MNVYKDALQSWIKRSLCTRDGPFTCGKTHAHAVYSVQSTG